MNSTVAGGLTASLVPGGMGSRILGASAPATQAMDMVIAPLTGSIGDVLTVTSINADMQGTPLGTATLIGFTNPTTTLTYTKLAAAAGTPMTVPMKVGASIYDGTTNKAIRFDCNNPPPAGSSDTWEGFNIPATAATIFSLLAVAYVKLGSGSDPDQSVSINHDWLNISGSGFAVAQQIQAENGLTNFLHGHSDGDLGNTITVDPTKIYELQLFYNDTARLGQVLLLDGNTVVGSSDSILGGDSGAVVYALLQNYLTNRAGVTDVYLVGFNWTDPTFPSRPITVPSVYGMGLSQTNFNELTLTFNSVVTRFNIEISSDGGAHWATVESNLRMATVGAAKSFTASLSNGVTYRYRVTALINATASSPVTSSDVTVDNANFHGSWAPTITGNSVASAASGKRGCKMTVGSVDIPVTQLGCWFWGPGDTYTDVEMQILASDLTPLASATVLLSGSTPSAMNYATVSGGFTMLANTTYFLLRDVSGFNAYSTGGTQPVNTSLAARIAGADETGTDPGAGADVGAVDFKF